MFPSRLQPFVVPLALATSALALSLLFAATPAGRQVENLTLDWRFRARAPSDPPADPRLLAVGIAEDGLEQWGRWPWPRSVHGDLLQLLTKRPPDVVAFDLLFSEPSQEPAEDTHFGDALVQFPGAITGASVDQALPAESSSPEAWTGNTRPIERVSGDISRLTGQDEALLPVPYLAESSRTGFVNADPGPDGIRRTVPVVVRWESRIFPSLALQLLLAAEGVDTNAVEVDLQTRREVRVQAGDRIVRIPVDDRGHYRINYRRPDQIASVTYFGLFFALSEVHQGRPWPEAVPSPEGKVLLVGQTAAGLTDLGPTPHAARQPLMLVHLHALDNFLRQDHLRPVPVVPAAMAWFVLALGMVVLLRHAPVPVAILAPLAAVVAYAGIAFAAFSMASRELPLVWPVLGLVLVNGGSIGRRLILESRSKARIKGMFGTYVAPTVVDQILRSGEEPKLGGSEAEITAFFSDIAGFSSFSELLPPRQLVHLMNDYLTEMTDILHEHGGTLDKFIGDAIVGMFGAPLWFPGHAHQACLAAAEMQRCQIMLRERWRAEGGWPDLVLTMKTRIGLNSGLAVIGNMGSRRRFNYTMMGDTVNLAARTESGAKAYGVETMVTGETRNLSLAHGDSLRFRYLDKLVVKGRSQPVEMHELVGFEADLPANVREGLERYEDAVRLYLDREFDRAAKGFAESARLERSPGDNPSLVLAERCAVFLARPPGPDWNGEHVMASK